MIKAKNFLGNGGIEKFRIFLSDLANSRITEPWKSIEFHLVTSGLYIYFGTSNFLMEHHLYLMTFSQCHWIFVLIM